MPKERVTLVLPPGLWEKTKRLARERRTSASELTAQALQKLTQENDMEARLAAVRSLASYNLPVGTPEEIEDEIIAGAIACLPEIELSEEP